MLLATRLTRARWAIASGLGVFAAIALMTAFIAVGTGIGVAPSGSDVLAPMAGAVVLGLYAAALAGIGFAVGGLVRGSFRAARGGTPTCSRRYRCPGGSCGYGCRALLHSAPRQPDLRR